jgi:hypothetical protein
MGMRRGTAEEGQHEKGDDGAFHTLRIFALTKVVASKMQREN